MAYVDLSPWAKLLIMALGSAAVMVTIVIVACVVGPGCWIHELILKKEKKHRSEAIALSYVNKSEHERSRLTLHAQDSITSADSMFPSTHPHTAGSRYTRSPSTSSQSTVSTCKDSTYSSMSNIDSGHDSCSDSIRSNVMKAKSEPSLGGETRGFGQVTFSLQYLLSPGKNKGTLVIGLKEARDLPPREYLGLTDPYFVLSLVRSKRSIRQQRTVLIADYKSIVMKKTSNPVYNQDFPFEIGKDEIADCSIKICAFDHDKFANPSLIGETIQPLKDVQQIKQNMEKLSLTYYLNEVKQNFGDVLFGISYLPTAKRLSFSVIKANNLKYTKICSNVQDFNPYIRILMINQTGRAMKKKKTSTKRGTASPVYNESLIFDLTHYSLHTVTFLIICCHKTRMSADTSEDNLDSTDDAAISLTRRRERIYLGKVALGGRVRCETATQHWTEMCDNQRKIISHWHTFR